MKKVLTAAVGAAFVVGLLPADDSFAASRNFRPQGKCSRYNGKGDGLTQELAKAMARGAVTQASGNWPVENDRLANERYSCKVSTGTGIWTCRSQIDICK